MRWRRAAWLGLLVACGSRSDLTRSTLSDSDDASGNAGQAGLGGSGGARPPGGAGAGGSGTSAGGSGVGSAGIGSVEPDPGEPPGVDGDAPPLCSARPLTLDQTLSAALDDLTRLPASERAFMRYVSLGYRRTIACAGGEQPQRPGARDLALLVNLTSAAASIGLPAPIGPTADSLLRIDLRHYGWERELVVAGGSHPDAWEAIAASSALALEYSGPEADVLRAESATRFPLLSFSDLLAQSTRGELYYELVGLPDTLAELAARFDAPLGYGACRIQPYAGAVRQRDFILSAFWCADCVIADFTICCFGFVCE